MADAAGDAAATMVGWDGGTAMLLLCVFPLPRLGGEDETLCTSHMRCYMCSSGISAGELARERCCRVVTVQYASRSSRKQEGAVGWENWSTQIPK